MVKESLKSLAVDIVEGKVFCDRYIKEPNLIPAVFIPLMFNCFKDWNDDQIQDLGLIYEYMDKAGPRSLNGYPQFFSFLTLNKEETSTVLKYADEYREIKKKFKQEE